MENNLVNLLKELNDGGEVAEKVKKNLEISNQIEGRKKVKEVLFANVEKFEEGSKEREAAHSRYETYSAELDRILKLKEKADKELETKYNDEVGKIVGQLDIELSNYLSTDQDKEIAEKNKDFEIGNLQVIKNEYIKKTTELKKDIDEMLEQKNLGQSIDEDELNSNQTKVATYSKKIDDVDNEIEQLESKHFKSMEKDNKVFYKLLELREKILNTTFEKYRASVQNRVEKIKDNSKNESKEKKKESNETKGKNKKQETENSKNESKEKKKESNETRGENKKQETVNSKITSNEEDIKILEQIMEHHKDDLERYNTFKLIVDSLKLENDKIKNEEQKSEYKNQKIILNKKDIEKLKKLILKHKDDPTRCENFQRMIDKLEAENAELNGDGEMTTQIVPYTQQKPLTQMPPQIQQKPLTQMPPQIQQEPLTQMPPQIQSQGERPIITFDVKTGKYMYRNELGEMRFFDGYKEDKDGNYISVVNTAQDKENIKKYCKSVGISVRKSKMIDLNVYNILNRLNPILANNYISAFKEGEDFDMGFDLEYDFRKKGKKIERDIGKQNIRKLKRQAKNQQKLGIAMVVKDKSRAKLYAILAAMGITSGVSAMALLNKHNRDIEPVQTNSDLNYDYNNIKNDIDDGIKNSTKNNKKDENKQENTVQNSETQNIEENEQIHSGDYITINGGSLLFRNPTDWIRMKQGQNASEKVYVKPEASSDRLYKVTMEGYYAPDGTYVSIKEGENINEALKAKGLDKSFLKNEDTIKMYHAVADGIAQWVNADDVEKNKERVDKFGNSLDKTAEEKLVDEAAKNYNKSQEINKER